MDGQTGKNIVVPEGSARDELLNWIQKLPDIQTPSWLGLPNNAEKVLLTNLGRCYIYIFFCLESMYMTETLFHHLSTFFYVPTTCVYPAGGNFGRDLHKLIIMGMEDLTHANQSTGQSSSTSTTQCFAVFISFSDGTWLRQRGARIVFMPSKFRTSCCPTVIFFIRRSRNDGKSPQTAGSCN